jgi:very-short-patch-repair endonuclease
MRLHPHEITTCRRIPVTTPARTLLDLAAGGVFRDFERALAEAQIRRLVRRRELAELLQRNQGRRGSRVLRGALAAETEPVLTRSEAEERLLELVRHARLPPPEGNVRLGEHEVDLLWRKQRLIVEIDGFRFHSSRAAFERDRIRDAELQANGFRVIRVTWRQIVREPDAMLARIARLLAAVSRS